MTEEQIIDWLGFGILIAWVCKIGFHFVYLKAVDSRIKEMNFVLFYLNFRNILTSFVIVSPLFFARAGSAAEEIKIIRRAKISTLVLWTMFVLMGFYQYNHPPKKEPTRIEYDFTKGSVK